MFMCNVCVGYVKHVEVKISQPSVFLAMAIGRSKIVGSCLLRSPKLKSSKFFQEIERRARSDKCSKKQNLLSRRSIPAKKGYISFRNET